MKIKQQSSLPKCNLEIYTLFLLSEPKLVSCVRLSEILEDLSHDSINRFLIRENYTAQDLFEEIRHLIVLEKGTLSVDDMVIDKPYSNPEKAELIDYFWSGKHHRTVKGINIITLYHRAVKQVCKIERFQVRKTSAIRTHVFSSIRAFVKLELLRFHSQIINWYQLKRNMFNKVISSFILKSVSEGFLDLNNLGSR